MIPSRRFLRPVPRPDPESRPRRARLLSACAVIDAVAAILLLRSAPSPPGIESVGAVLHLMAILLLALAPDSEPSRRWMGVATVLAIPGAGAAVLVALSGVKTHDLAGIERRPRTARRRPFPLAAARRLERRLSVCDALYSADEEQRLSALSILAGREDPEAWVLLRRATAGGDPERAMQAALAMDRFYERAERRRMRPPGAPASLGARA